LGSNPFLKGIDTVPSLIAVEDTSIFPSIVKIFASPGAKEVVKV
jgi:hypothetical protein